jgi:hypothetical protein
MILKGSELQKEIKQQYNIEKVKKRLFDDDVCRNLYQYFIQRRSAALPDIDFTLPEFAVLVFETMELVSRKKNPS